MACSLWHLESAFVHAVPNLADRGSFAWGNAALMAACSDMLQSLSFLVEGPCKVPFAF